MSGFSGKNGDAKGARSGGNPTQIVEVTDWSFEPKSGVPKWCSNVSSPFKTGVAGTRDSSGKISCKLDGDGNMPWHDGDLVDLELYADKTLLPGSYIEVTAIIENTPLNVKIDGDGEAPTVEYSYQGIGEWTPHGIFCRGTGSSSSSGA